MEVGGGRIGGILGTGIFRAEGAAGDEKKRYKGTKAQRHRGEEAQS